MKITCISDTHMHHKKIIIPNDTDMIIHAGDFTYHGELQEVNRFLDWYETLLIEHKILISGNHEVETSSEDIRRMCVERGITYLDNDIHVVNGFTIWGSPYSNKFGRWAYMASEYELEEMYKEIPDDVDILITHGPAYSKLDWCPNGNVGSKSLLKRIDELQNLQLHVTGHIHESRGCAIHTTNTHRYLTVNAAICGIPYTDVIINPITVEI